MGFLDIQCDKETLLEKLSNKIDEMPLLQDVLQQLLSVQVDETQNAKITIVKQNFKKCENITYEKLLK
jgi:DNA-binding FrmR family transcriptional regulator